MVKAISCKRLRDFGFCEGVLLLSFPCFVKTVLIYTDEMLKFLYLCKIFQKMTNGSKKSIGDGC